VIKICYFFTKGACTIMNTKKLFVLALVLALVLSANASFAASADGAVVPFKGTYSGVPVGVFDPACMCVRQTFEFDGTATHLGLSHFSATATVYPNPPSLRQEGGGKFISADGDELHWSFKGEGTFLPNGLVEFWGVFWFEGGTGRFEGVTGEGAYSGMATAQGSPDPWGKIDFRGTLIK
jgi:hypothetical protein